MMDWAHIHLYEHLNLRNSGTYHLQRVTIYPFITYYKSEINSFENIKAKVFKITIYKNISIDSIKHCRKSECFQKLSAADASNNINTCE